MTKIKLPRLISDGMVLQRNAQTKIWGWAPAGEVIIVRFIDEICQTTVDTNEEWQVIIQTQNEGGPYDMVIETGEGTDRIIINNILLGDVWLCSGQSNMEMKMDSVRDTYPEEIAQACNSAIRQFLVPEKYDFDKPLTDYEAGGWEAVYTQSILSFSAVEYFFAAKLFEEYHVPIGLISASLGGSPAQAWLSEDTLSQFPVYLEDAKRLKDRNYMDAILRKDQTTLEEWYCRINQNDAGMPIGEIPCFAPGYDASAWPSTTLPSYWEDEGLGHFNGVVWFRKEIELYAGLIGNPAKLFLGNIVDEDTVYINGTKVGTVPMQYVPRKYDIPEGLLKEGRNTIVVRVVNFAGKGGFYKGKPYYVAIEDQRIDLCGEWQYMIGAKSDPMPAPAFVQWRPLGLYNGMLAPAIDYAIKGALWYQGESNTGKTEEYDNLLKALIEDWRKKWGQGDFPFLYVQLPNYMEASDCPTESSWAELREAQRRVLAVPKTGMAVTIDLGEWNDIHPANKKDVGNRLALAAQRVAYDDKAVMASGPLFLSAVKEGNQIMLSFSNTGSGLVTNDGNQPGYFAIAGADKSFVWADTEIEDDCVIVWSKQISNPIYVRYAWADNPEGANLYNREGLPASPFTAQLPDSASR